MLFTRHFFLSLTQTHFFLSIQSLSLLWKSQLQLALIPLLLQQQVFLVYGSLNFYVKMKSHCLDHLRKPPNHLQVLQRNLFFVQVQDLSAFYFFAFCALGKKERDIYLFECYKGLLTPYQMDYYLFPQTSDAKVNTAIAYSQPI